jgi:hypothetical protein
MKKVKAVFGKFLFLFILGGAFSLGWAANWVKINEEDGIVVYEKDIKGTSLVAFKGVTTFDEPMEKILWVLKDDAHKKDWIELYLKGHTLEKRGSFERVIYQAVDSPWPVNDRDMIYVSKAYRKGVNEIQISMESVTHPDSPPTVGVRMSLNFSNYNFKKLENGKTQVTLEIHSDPKGWIPKWIVNMVQRTYPIKLFKALKKQLKKSFVGKSPLPE